MTSSHPSQSTNGNTRHIYIASVLPCPSSQVSIRIMPRSSNWINPFADFLSNPVPISPECPRHDLSRCKKRPCTFLSIHVSRRCTHNRRRALRLPLDIVLVHIHRTFFTRALSDPGGLHLSNQYAPSVVAIFRSACDTIMTVEDLHKQEPALAGRFSCIWSNAFAAAVSVLFIRHQIESQFFYRCHSVSSFYERRSVLWPRLLCKGLRTCGPCFKPRREYLPKHLKFL
jgi:hypothetical protein